MFWHGSTNGFSCAERQDLFCSKPLQWQCSLLCSLWPMQGWLLGSSPGQLWLSASDSSKCCNGVRMELRGKRVHREDFSPVFLLALVEQDRGRRCHWEPMASAQLGGRCCAFVEPQVLFASLLILMSPACLFPSLRGANYGDVNDAEVLMLPGILMTPLHFLLFL